MGAPAGGEARTSAEGTDADLSARELEAQMPIEGQLLMNTTRPTPSQHGGVRIGDALIGINDVQLHDTPFDDVSNSLK
jgi:biotin synthase-related radical SAM superfamily protein